jgi:hypothetical protein
MLAPNRLFSNLAHWVSSRRDSQLDSSISHAVDSISALRPDITIREDEGAREQGLKSSGQVSSVELDLMPFGEERQEIQKIKSRL